MSVSPASLKPTKNVFFPEFSFVDRGQRDLRVRRQRQRGDDPHQAASAGTRSGEQADARQPPHQRNYGGQLIRTNPGLALIILIRVAF